MAFAFCRLQGWHVVDAGFKMRLNLRLKLGVGCASYRAKCAVAL